MSTNYQETAAKAVEAFRANGNNIRATVRATGYKYHVVRDAVHAAGENVRPRRTAAKKAAPPAPAPTVSGTVDVSAVLAALVESQRQQAEILARLVSGQPAVPQSAKATEVIEAEQKPSSGGSVASPESSIIRETGRRFVVTCAQNNTQLHEGFWKSLEHYCVHNQSKLLISRFSYNTHGWRQPEKPKENEPTEEDEDESEFWYAPEIAAYVCDKPVLLAPGLLFCGELNISPTATDPLSGLDSYARECSAIVPHTKVAMKSLATMKDEPAKLLYTTGTCTLRNYLERKAGQKASFHHVFGALAVEVDDDGTWFVRQLVASDDGSFQDFDTLYTPDGIRHAEVAAITWGDFHEEKADPIVHAACFAPGGILDFLRPSEQHVHDLADMRGRNHHNLKDPYFLAAMHYGGTEKVENDIKRCAAKLEIIERPWCKTIVIESNHDQALRKWLCEADGHRDPPNAKYWHFWNYRIFEAIERGQDLFVFEAAVRAAAKSALHNTRFLREDTSWVICADKNGGIECGLHGHRGPNGSRGSPKSYRQMGRRCNTAHTHSAQIVDGIYTAGVSGSVDMGYNVGPSSWSQSHILTYESGKRAIITMRGARWRGSPLTEKPRIRVRATSIAA